MKDILFTALLMLACVWIGYRVGWVCAHIAIGMECERLGGFFVGEKIYKCHLQENAAPPPPDPLAATDNPIILWKE